MDKVLQSLAIRTLVTHNVNRTGGDPIMRRSAPINLVVPMPQTVEGKAELAKRVASVHADAVTQRMKSLSCPTAQKLELLDTILQTTKEKNSSP